MIRSFFCSFSLESGVTIILWMSLCSGIMLMLSPNNNVSYTTYYPSQEFWDGMETMRKNWLLYWQNERSLMNNVTKKYRPIINDTWIQPSEQIPTQTPNIQPPFFYNLTFPNYEFQFPDPGSVANEIKYGVSWSNIPLGFIQVLVSGYGLYGIYEEEGAKYLSPYLGWSIIYPIITTTINLFSPMGFFVLGYLMSLIQIAFYVYFVLIVYIYRSTSLKSKKNYRGLNQV